MELPSYSKQLLQQLYALCKEQQFCDCTIFVGNVHFRAHKVVLAAASLLFKSLLDSTDTISIDASVMTPEEFALLLEMMYSGKLPLGKHNFTKVISVADSLQMFDVAVSCKNLLRDLISCSTQDQVVREVSSRAADSSGNHAEANNLPQSEKPDEGKTDILLPQRVSPFPGPLEAEMEADVSPGQELAMNHTWVQQNTMLSDSRSLQEDSGSCPDQPACARQGRCVEEELAEPLDEKGGARDLAAESKSCKLDFFLQYESVFSEALSDNQAVLKRLEECREIDASQKEVAVLIFIHLHSAKWTPEDYGAKLLRQYRQNLVELLTDTQTLLQGISAAQSLAPTEREAMEQVVKCEAGGFASLVSAALEERSLSVSAIWQLLLAVREPAPLNLLMDEIRKQPGAEFFFQAGFVMRKPFESWPPSCNNNQLEAHQTESMGFIGVATSESTAIEIILRHSKLISEAIQQRVDPEGLAPGEAQLTEAVKELLSISAQKESSEASLKAALSTAQERSVPAIKICQLLCNVHESFPDLQPVMQELGHVGLLTEGSGEKPGIRKWKVNSESQVEALDKDEDKVGDATAKELREPQEKASSKKTFVCKACNKTFHFYCRLKVHMKRCRVARGKQIQCKECSEVKSTKKELEKHQLEVHGVMGMAKKKKKRLPVACDICGREFAHASGMQYHKLTEHFDEKPFTCEECGAKFAANSTLKNHLRLHTGDRPFMCKHCLMTFMQASALAYHTKKKHAEGKMYGCQYCDAVFAQSIELSRHVRTHTGDKPYVCRECGKGFRQANGLSIHLRTFHNIEDPYDCKKCRMSFATLQEHRKHVHEAHSREYHPCPTCTKVFSAPSLLERHMVTHVGGKPFSCEICDKAYQQLSGLWYHNRTHHPDVFAAQNHRSSKFSSLQCSSCDKTFSSTAAHRKHVKTEHTDVKFHECETCKELFPTLALLQVHVKCRHSGSQLFCCLYCSASFRFPGALQNHVTSEHFKQTESTFTCKLCGELFPSQGELEGHYSAEHPKVVFSQATTAQIVQVIQTSEQGAAEHIISFDNAQLAGSQVFVTLPESQASQTGSELVAVTMEDLFDDKVTLICEEAK
ncbi:LOW QUALITY PROTEIN: zinc finger and BTB domain-containing protein 40 [Haliaeetus albicilla]|uniref:LOW QUALITY PROTEIN: zinc finger and BTB domain-containing protein 40 n=1 Tax=Haliaeetus albicilla TaxID=8969 RepID=UPI0037E6FBA9